MSKSILITGGAGFVGSSLALLIKQHYPHYDIFAMDNLKRRGSELNIPRLQKNGIKFVHGDIRNKEDFDNIPVVNAVIEASAEPSVLAGLDSTPDYLVNTNLAGTINCLNFATKHKADFIFLSTSRVYPIAEIEKINFEEAATRFNISAKQTIKGISPKGLSEEFNLDGYRSLYGATKLSSELMIQEYSYFYGIKTVINRCSIITGPWQMGKVDQGVVVLWIAKHFWKQSLSYIGYGGTGKQVRDILHVNDLYRLVDYELHNMEKINGNIYNAGGSTDVSVSLQELTTVCEKLTGNKIPIKQVAENRTADIRIYVTDNTKITSATGWKPKVGVEQTMEDVYKWIRDNENQLQYILK